MAAAWFGAVLGAGLPAHGEDALPPLQSREVGTMPVHQPKDLLLPGEKLRRRWANGEDTVSSGPPVRSAAPGTLKAPGRAAAPRPALPVPPRPAATASAAAPPIPWARPATTVTMPAAKPGKPRKPGSLPVLNLQPGCSGQFQLDGMAVDAMGRPCFSGG